MKALRTVWISLTVLVVGVLALTGNSWAQARALPSPMYGVTLDSVSGLSYIVDSLGSLRQKPVTRIVFDEFIDPGQYTNAVNRIRPVSYIMGELLDSAYVKQYSVQQYRQRTTDYLNAFVGKVDLWEIGNEINGEWLGGTQDVVLKMTGAYDLVKARGEKTALTLYYNKNCWEKPAHEMFTWAQANIPNYMKLGLDYVFISYYEDDCNGLQPNWPEVINRLAAMFPNSKIGIGECGTTRRARKEEYIRRYYGMQIDHPQFVGGWFWWYGRQDFVPKSKALWNVLYQMVP